MSQEPTLEQRRAGWPPYSALAAENKMLSDRIEEYEIFLRQYKMEQRFGDWKRGRDAGLAPSEEPPTIATPTPTAGLNSAHTGTLKAGE